MSDDNSPTRYYQVLSHENNGEPTVQYAAWGHGAAALFVLGEPATDGYTASDPSAEPDPTALRPATVLYLFKNVRHQEELQRHLARILLLDALEELVDRPPIGDVDLSRFPADHLLLATLFA